jgi:hypothetical protein
MSRSDDHGGWRLISGRYDDGAFSGASLERPALQQLLADVRAGKIDIVLVYKVDRLTRSLADFANRPRSHPHAHETIPQRLDCVAGHEGLELGNVVANYPFEKPDRFPGISRIPATETVRV